MIAALRSLVVALVWGTAAGCVLGAVLSIVRGETSAFWTALVGTIAATIVFWAIDRWRGGGGV